MIRARLVIKHGTYQRLTPEDPDGAELLAIAQFSRVGALPRYPFVDAKSLWLPKALELFGTRVLPVVVILSMSVP